MYRSRRLIHLYTGLALYGISAALQIQAALGLNPWDVLHQGLSKRSGLSIGLVSIIVGAAVLLLWIPLRQRPGLGTISNVFIVGLAMDATLRVVPAPEHLGARVPLLLFAVVLNGVATGLYISARFGPGPRDGLMTGLHAATGRSIRLVRTGIEVAVVATGFLLGGGVGVGTVLYALSIGPLAQIFLRVFAVPAPRRERVREEREARWSAGTDARPGTAGARAGSAATPGTAAAGTVSAPGTAPAGALSPPAGAAARPGTAAEAAADAADGVALRT